MHLDFVNARRPVGAAGWLVLLLGICAIAAVVAWHRLHWQQLAAADADRLRALEMAIALHRTPVPKIPDAELAGEWQRAIAVAEDLNLPWDDLFATLEAEVERPVAILSLESDARKRAFVLECEARKLDDMLAYYRLLQQRKIFSGLTLHTHRINRQDAQRPIRFRVTAKWAAKP